MSPGQWQRLKEILADALEVPSGELSSFIAERTSGDSELASEIEELLAQEGVRDSFSTLSAPSESDGLGPGVQLGHFTILRELARGGAGVVYLAQKQDQPGALAAVKVVSSRPGGDIQRRFRAERLILASLDHAGITRLLDYGRTPSGEPYLVQEYVDGLPIDQYCLVHRLNTRRRIELFQRVCASVDYAHQRQIVHRDLKPSNILVTAEGEPKLLDFGIAKLLDSEAITRSALELTKYGAQPMTPEYASPEQARGDVVAAASDIYSLGVLLYWLLAGRLPYEVRGGSLGEVIESICNGEPDRLRDLPPSLEAVVFRCLEKEAGRRYASAAELGRDLGDWLAGRQVRAAAGGRSLKRKFLRRHALVLSLACVSFACLVGGLWMAVYQWRIAGQQSVIAAKARAQSVRRLADNQRLASSFLYNAAGRLAAFKAGPGMRRGVLNEAASMLDSLAMETQDGEAAPEDLGQAYLYLSALQSDPSAGEAADPVAAQWSAIQAQRIFALRVSRAGGKGWPGYMLALCYLRLADAYTLAGEFHSAMATYDEAKHRFERLDSISEDLERFVATQAPVSQVTPEVIRAFRRQTDSDQAGKRVLALLQLGDAYSSVRLDDRALAIYLADEEIHRGAMREFPSYFPIRMNYAWLMMSIGDLYSRRGEVGRAHEYYVRGYGLIQGAKAPNGIEYPKWLADALAAKLNSALLAR